MVNDPRFLREHDAEQITQQPGDVVERLAGKARALHDYLVEKDQPELAGTVADIWGTLRLHEAELARLRAHPMTPQRPGGVVERVAVAIERTMFAPHEFPLDAELHAKYLHTARAAISAMDRLRAQPDAAAMREALEEIDVTVSYVPPWIRRLVSAALLCPALPLPPAAENDGG